MAWTVPADLEDVMHAATRAALGDGPLATPALTRAIIDRSRRYTSERDRAPSDRTADLAARAMFFTIADAMKIAIPLSELASRNALPTARPLRIVDLGAGCGAMSLGAIAALTTLPTVPTGIALDITAIDRDSPALAIARTAVLALAARRGISAEFKTRDADLSRVAIPPADLVVIGTVLNELPVDLRLDLIHRALATLGDDGAVIAIEPALRDTARALHQVRDAVLSSGRGHVFAPCTRTLAPCPALTDPDDWCHEDRPLQLPRRTAELARLTHLRDGGMKFAYLVLRRHPLSLVDIPADASAWRVVSAPMPAKGKLELIGCSASGRIPIRLLRRHRTPANRGIESAVRGDVLVISSASPDDARVELTADARVDHLTPAAPRPPR